LYIAEGYSRSISGKKGLNQVYISSNDVVLRNFVKKDELLAEIQLNAQRAGLDKMTEDEIEIEVQASRRSKREKNK